IILQLERAVQEAGYRLSTYGLRHESQLSALSETFNAQTVDGIISPEWFAGKIQHVTPPDVSLLLLADADNVSEDVDVVSIDACATVFAMTQYLLNFGHERIGIVLNSDDTVKQHRDIIRGA